MKTLRKTQHGIETITNQQPSAETRPKTWNGSRHSRKPSTGIEMTGHSKKTSKATIDTDLRSNPVSAFSKNSLKRRDTQKTQHGIETVPTTRLPRRVPSTSTVSFEAGFKHDASSAGIRKAVTSKNTRSDFILCTRLARTLT